jgi:hypothetical protein
MDESDGRLVDIPLLPGVFTHVWGLTRFGGKLPALQLSRSSAGSGDTVELQSAVRDDVDRGHDVIHSPPMRIRWRSFPVQIRRNRQVVLASMLAAMAPVFVSSHAIGQTATDSASRGETADQASTVAAARSLAQQGVRLAESGQCAEAVSKLERAEALRHSAIVAEQLGTCYIALGRLVEGTEMFRAVLREAMPAAASPALSRAYERAEQGLRNERRRIGSLIVNIVGPGDAAVELDGKLFPTALLGAARPTDPGAHALEVTALGYLPKHEALVLAPGEHREISLRLVKDPAYVAAADSSAGPAQNRLAASSSALPVAGVPAKSGRGLRIASYTLWGVGAAGLGVGAGFAFSALSAKNDLDHNCESDVCPASQRGTLHDGKRDGNVATGMLAGGGAAVVAGTVLFLLARPHTRVDVPKTGSVTFGASARTGTLRLAF